LMVLVKSVELNDIELSAFEVTATFFVLTAVDVISKPPIAPYVAVILPETSAPVAVNTPVDDT
jgi:hypothetical protein